MHYPSHPLHVVYIMLSIRSRPAQIRAQCSQSMQSFDAFRATTILDNNNTNAGMTPLYLQPPLQPRREESCHDCRAGAGGLCESFLRRNWRELMASNHIALALRSHVLRSGIHG
ncbi:hypothetical protein XPA_005062 [Xanthoria parietina]